MSACCCNPQSRAFVSNAYPTAGQAALSLWMSVWGIKPPNKILIHEILVIIKDIFKGSKQNNIKLVEKFFFEGYDIPPAFFIFMTY